MQIETTSGTSATRHWLNPTRLYAYSVVVLLMQWALLFIATWSSRTHFGHMGGADFPTFWSASRLWHEGVPLKAYSYDALVRTAQQISPQIPVPGPFSYPPTYFLLLWPVALASCSVASAVFSLVTAGGFILLQRKVLPLRAALLPILAFPGIWMNIAQGQNACLTASLALGTILLMERRPVLAGICLGMLSIKPHLALLFPIALAFAGMWTVLAVAGLTALLLTGLSIGVFGLGVIPAFLNGVALAGSTLTAGIRPWGLSASLFSSLRAMHVAVTPAYCAQACQAIVATLAVIYVWRRTHDMSLRGTALLAASCMISPYIFNYDTVWLGAAIALFTAKALRDGWLAWEREILCIAWFYPPFGNLAGSVLHIGVGPLVLTLVLGLAVRRVRNQDGMRRQGAGETTDRTAQPQAM